MKSTIAAMICALVLAGPAEAQRIPGRDRGGSPRDLQSRERDPQRAAAAQAAQDPFAALERELPSLKVDLRLTAAQVEAWSVFERDVREAAELDRARRRHLMALRDSSDRAPTALTVMAMLSEDDRQKADASADMRRHIEALYAQLDDPQKRMIDRRVILSQTEPLGR
jgi:hypothetical protein